MKRPWAVMIAAAFALGCRSSQPTTNPFLRTTVAPPATGQGAVVVPGEPYYPGTAPAVGSAPWLCRALPLRPPWRPARLQPVAPPVAAPPPAVTPLRDNKYSPPGGSFQYNQSKLDRPARVAPVEDQLDEVDETELADRRSPGGDEEQPLEELELSPIDHAVEQATALSSEPDPVECAVYYRAHRAGERHRPEQLSVERQHCQGVGHARAAGQRGADGRIIV